MMRINRRRRCTALRGAQRRTGLFRRPSTARGFIDDRCEGRDDVPALGHSGRHKSGRWIVCATPCAQFRDAQGGRTRFFPGTSGCSIVVVISRGRGHQAGA